MTTAPPYSPPCDIVPGLTVGRACGPAAGGGISPAGPVEFVNELVRTGHAVAYFCSRQSSAHRVCGCGIQHDDAAFIEQRGAGGSMAAYYENGEAFGGRWWEDTGVGYSVGVRHYGCASTSVFRGAGHGGVRRTEASVKLAAASGVVDPSTTVVWS